MYLARLPDPDLFWVDDKGKRGWLPVVFKQEVRYARPCLPLGEFSAPTKEWVKANHKKYMVWLAFEDQLTARRSEDSLIYMGFMPIGGEDYPEASGVEEDYPQVEVRDRAPWRMVLNKKLPLTTISVADELGEDQVAVALDGTATISGASQAFVAYVPYGDKSLSITANAASEGTESISLVHGSGMAVTLVGGGKNSVVIKNSAGDAYVEVNDDGVVINAKKVVIQGSVVAGGSPTAANVLREDKFIAHWALYQSALAAALASSVPPVVFNPAPLAAAMPLPTDPITGEVNPLMLGTTKLKSS